MLRIGDACRTTKVGKLHEKCRLGNMYFRRDSFASPLHTLTLLRIEVEIDIRYNRGWDVAVGSADLALRG